MKYKLKDKELAEHLRAIYPEFDKELESVCDSQMNDGCDFVLIQIFRPKGLRLNLLIYKSEIEAIYDPKSWNIFPSVTPPEGKLMRVEMYEPAENDGPEYKPEKVHYRLCAIYEHGWRYCYGSNALIQRTQNLRIRYRPWED